MDEQKSFAELLDVDKDMVMTNIARDRSLPAAQETLEKAVDRVMYRFVEQCTDVALRDSAQYILQTMKNTLPMMDTVGEAREWKKQVDTAARKAKGLKPSAMALMLTGFVLVLASVLGTLIGSRSAGTLAFVKSVVPAVMGCASLFWAGVLAARPPKKAVKVEDDESPVRVEYLVDDDKAWHCLRGVMLLADGQLEAIRQENDVQKQAQAREAARADSPASTDGPLSAAELDLFAELLENAYVEGGESAEETISAIRFFLHNAKIDVVDYEPGHESWFEFLPAVNKGTIRPALTSEGKLLKKGMAST